MQAQISGFCYFITHNKSMLLTAPVLSSRPNDFSLGIELLVIELRLEHSYSLMALSLLMKGLNLSSNATPLIMCAERVCFHALEEQASALEGTGLRSLFRSAFLFVLGGRTLRPFGNTSSSSSSSTTCVFVFHFSSCALWRMRLCHQSCASWNLALTLGRLMERTC